MSLIRLRRERREGMGNGPARPPSTWKLILGFVLVALAIWYLSAS